MRGETERKKGHSFEMAWSVGKEKIVKQTPDRNAVGGKPGSSLAEKYYSRHLSCPIQYQITLRTG
jgi:hypothetical protein